MRGVRELLEVADPQPAAARLNAARAPALTLVAVMGSGRSVDEAPEWARALLARERVARLGLIDDAGAPRVLPVTFALVGGRLVSAVDQKPKRVTGGQLARVRWLRMRPRAALTVDRYEEDWSRLAWVQALGSVLVLHPAEAPDAVAALVARYVQYRERAPEGPLLMLEPERLLWWRASAGH